uniref:ATP-dependent RNA helicase DDX54 n=1 Tax=Ciona intestinalis TaxID=7719 RepID=UPI000180CC42|nr:ATP-dependent RNA helicase DDX54 [Ciona intestinalis]XP_026692180.1 ATP-dependent RNA helicase DDX54 [Ciona intestinalis]|eukprot:XP_002130371.1 ATP-dependent RNA helicase DDX54 [Ciona intestinalis]
MSGEEMDALSESEDDTDITIDEVPGTNKKTQNDVNELLSILDDGYTSEAELNTRKLVTQMNRKKKKSGGFQSMGLSHSVFKGVIRKGYKVPTPIQRKCIPLILSDKDVVAMARTGSGKTAAFLIPMFEKLQGAQSGAGARALLLSPTRELALQTLKFVKELGRFTSLRTACILGGDSMDEQFSAMHENPDVTIATPGRLMHVLIEMELRLSNIHYVVFDEADRLFELGFQEQLHEVLHRLPDDRQTLLFSATLPKQLVEFAKAGLNDPTLVRLDLDSKLSDQLKLAFLHLREDDKLPALIHLLRNVFKETEQTVVFVSTKHHVEFVKDVLKLFSINCSYVYSSLDHTARKINIAKFRNKKTMVLIVTDVAARGLDIPMLDNVINFSFPAKSKLFVHRVGRVARAGRTGTAYSLVCPEELAYVIDLHLFLGRPLNFAKTGQTYQAWDNVYGRVSQRIIDEEQAALQNIKNNSDLQALLKVAQNAYKQYLKSRPAASSESIKRSREILQSTNIALHPIYDESGDTSEEARLELLSSVRKYKPNSTIFEIGATAKSTGSYVMKKTRKRHVKFVEKHQQKLRKLAEKDEVSALQVKENIPEVVNEEEEEDLKNTFSKIVRPTNNIREFTEMKKKKKKKRTAKDFKDSEFYIDYKPKDHNTEAGLSIGNGRTNFAKEASNVTLDLIGDEDKTLRQQKMQRKVWDRKKKRFVNAQDAGPTAPKKKIRTESGALISSTYKKNIYQEWKKKTKLADRDEEVYTGDGTSGRWRAGQNRRLSGKQQNSNSKIKSELKRPEQILKQRKLQAQKKKNQQKRRKPKGRR